MGDYCLSLTQKSQFESMSHSIFVERFGHSVFPIEFRLILSPPFCRFFLARTIEKLLTTLEILSLYMACVLQGAELRNKNIEKTFSP